VVVQAERLLSISNSYKADSEIIGKLRA